ncbi:MAG: DNA polymerase I [Parcubacteria group bacterium Gr01-1014_18]|nr:MAG: DNA polymerase I [Parcubacteria group bacterium Greene0416_36]TSC81188.1 MAG: DNA polymerase I [Parcubacteria group bacterium Gr01-1014_18]TSC99185.1 MAG: DNA polymerase I [Parcubacteria group bacterium Greene1014_20]TSD07457.1 MAG: DNA polymerase I [Parcubacteria group bacterium Greene0714_2]
MKHPKFMLVDGNALLHRAWHAIPSLQTKDGKMVNAAYGFTSILLKAIKDLKPDYLAVAFDLRGPTFRHKMYKEYKATRTQQPQELYDQIPMIKEVLGSLGMVFFEKEGFEADDIIGTLSHHPALIEKKIEAVIVTGDRDALQLVDDRVKVYTFKKGISDTTIFDSVAVMEKYGLEPLQLLDMKAFSGDASDNIKGIKGIGEKTATGLVKAFGSVEKIYEALEADVPPSKILAFSPRIRKMLGAGKEDAILSKKLVTIARDVPIEFDLEKCKLGLWDQSAVFSVFSKYEFKSLLPKFNALAGESGGEVPVSAAKVVSTYYLVDSPEKMARFLALAEKQTAFAFDTETSSLHPIDSKCVGMSFSWKSHEGYYIHWDSKNPGYGHLEKLKKLLENPNIFKYGHNIKFDWHVLQTLGVHLYPLSFDTMIASYLCNPGSRAHSLGAVAFSELGRQKQEIETLIGSGKDQKSMSELSAEEIAPYAAGDADLCFSLVEIFRKRLDEKELSRLFAEMELPLVPVLGRMERYGIALDTDILKVLEGQVEKEMARLEKKIYDYSGEPFNILSSQQLAFILFEKLKVSKEGIKKIKTGLSLAAGELEKIEDRSPMIPLIVEYREFSKLLSTYIKSLPELVSPTTGRIHTNFNQTIAATGRLSSMDPNLQNIPTRTDWGREIRKAFVAEKGYVLVSADYSQIELRLVAAMAEDEAMIEAFKRGEDIHRRTAAEIHGIGLEEVTPSMRSAAKTINFGILYGQGAYALGRATGMTFAEAKEFIEKYFKVRPRVREYLNETRELAKKQGYVETLYGRIRYLPDIHSNVPMLRAQAERMAINMPVQGTAADLVKMAMIRVDSMIREIYKKEEVRMLLQVHDELVFEVKEDSVLEFSKKIKPAMEDTGRISLSVPILVDIKSGKNWGEMEYLFT